MPAVTVLLIENDPKMAWAISRVIEARGFPSPEVVTTGSEALEWISHNQADLCVLDRDLPEVKWPDFTLRIRQRRPDLPIHMISSAGTEEAAIAAFHAGVADYIPKTATLYEAVVRAVTQTAEAKAARAVPTHTTTIPEGIPPRLLQPTYQNRLRVIGRQIDLYGYRMVAVFEVEGGFLMRAFPLNGRIAEALEFPDRDFEQLVVQSFVVRGEGERPASNSPLLPSGYEDFFRAIGAALDQNKADSVSISEFSSMVVVGGNVRVENSAHTTLGNLQWVLHAEDIAQILDEGYRRRAALGKPAGNSVVDRIFGRQQPQTTDRTTQNRPGGRR
jgi:CheY-like chemotaxis protein